MALAEHDAGCEVLDISLDRAHDRQRLESTIGQHGMIWRHAWDGRSWDGGIVQAYDVHSIPFTVLIGRDGKVVGKDLRGEALERRCGRRSPPGSRGSP